MQKPKRPELPLPSRRSFEVIAYLNFQLRIAFDGIEIHFSSLPDGLVVIRFPVKIKDPSVDGIAVIPEFDINAILQQRDIIVRSKIKPRVS